MLLISIYGCVRNRIIFTSSSVNPKPFSLALALAISVAILVLAVTISLALLIFIVPTFEEMFADMGATLPFLTRFMLSLSRFVTSSTFVISAPLIIFSAIYLFFLDFDILHLS